MIYLITGTPGSGKTLYAVSTLVQKLASEKLRKRGKDIERRVVVDGIPNLVIPHEMMTPGVENDSGELVKADEGNGIWNWPEWCQPGDIIVVDEVQRWWRPRGMGSKPPREIKALETHRHMGVDFVLITQSPMLIDQNVRRLVGRHQHIRRLFGLARAIIYDWDGCSVDVHRVKNATTSYFGYPKSAYDLYKSSELHTKQKQKIPAWLAVPVLAVIGGLMVAPKAFSTMSGAMTGKGIGSSATTAKADAPPPPRPAALPASSAPVPVPPAPSEQVAQVPPRLTGCIKMGDRCSCFDQAGDLARVPPDQCEAGSHEAGFVLPGAATAPMSKASSASFS